MHREGTTLHHPFKPMPAYGALNSSFTINGAVHDPLTGLDTGSGNDRFNQYVTGDGSDQLQLDTGSGNDRFMGLEHGSGHDRLTGVGPNGFSEVEIHFATPLQENCANGTFLQENCANGTFLQENCANGNWLNQGQQGEGFVINDGSIAQHWGMVNHDNMQGLDAGNFTNFAMPVGDFI